MHTQHLIHNRVRLALHALRPEPEGRALLLLHGLGERTLTHLPAWADPWPGPVYGLDFTGHGESTVPVGGGYSSEMLMADADAAVQHLGTCTIVGRGVGAYAALLIAGGRPTQVLGAVLCDGPGIVGGGPGPLAGIFTLLPPHDGSAPDPWALFELSRDIRPPDYATTFVHLAAAGSALHRPIAVSARWRPQWLAAVADHPAVMNAPLGEALAVYAAAAAPPAEGQATRQAT